MSSIDTPDTLLKKADKIQTRFVLGALLAVIDLAFLVAAAVTSFFSFCAEKLGKQALAHGLHTFSLATYLVTVLAAFVIVSFMAILVIKILLMQKSLISMSKKLNKDAASLRLWLQSSYGVDVSEDESRVLVAGGSVHTFMGELSVIGQESSFLVSFNDELR